MSQTAKHSISLCTDRSSDLAVDASLPLLQLTQLAPPSHASPPPSSTWLIHLCAGNFQQNANMMYMTVLILCIARPYLTVSSYHAVRNIYVLCKYCKS